EARGRGGSTAGPTASPWCTSRRLTAQCYTALFRSPFSPQRSSMSRFIFTSESVSEGHPDKVCDFISDSILDACLEQDPSSRVACETLCKSDTVVIAGEITTNAKLDYERIVRQAVKEIGYTDKSEPFCDTTLKLIQLVT